MSEAEGRGKLDPDALLGAIAEHLESLGPFEEGAVRADKWRTTEQLLHELNPVGWNLAELDAELKLREVAWDQRLARHQPSNTRIRRAYYPDRTTVLPLWGATKWLEQPKLGGSRQRQDPPDDIPPDLRTEDGTPTVFLSYSSRDHRLAMQVARDSVALGLAPWMFETHIDHHGDIPASVKTALGDSACFLGVVTRNALGSLWILTELHTAYEMGKAIVMVFDATDDQLVTLLGSVRQHRTTGEPFDNRVQYNEKVVEELAEAYGGVEDPEQSQTYRQRVAGFLASLPMYQMGGAAIAYPNLPLRTLGPLTLAQFDDRMRVFGGTPCRTKTR